MLVFVLFLSSNSSPNSWLCPRFSWYRTVWRHQAVCFVSLGQTCHVMCFSSSWKSFLAQVRCRGFVATWRYYCIRSELKYIGMILMEWLSWMCGSVLQGQRVVGETAVQSVNSFLVKANPVCWSSGKKI